MDIQKEVSELAEYLRDKDLRRLEHHQQITDAYKIVDEFIKNEMSKNDKLLDGFKSIRFKLDCECCMCFGAVLMYQRRLNENRYEQEARRIIERNHMN